jgi:hypothetical protein
MIIRHGEKPRKKRTNDPGFDAGGRLDSHSLTRTGWKRAFALADALDGQSPARADLARPAAIYAAGSRAGGEGARTRETVAPLAGKLRIPVNTAFGKGEERALARSVAAQPGPVLISWQHQEIPGIAAAFGSVTPAPPRYWPDDRYDVVWTLTATPTGWRFAQVPEMLLAGDRPAAIID